MKYQKRIKTIAETQLKCKSDAISVQNSPEMKQEKNSRDKNNLILY